MPSYFNTNAEQQNAENMEVKVPHRDGDIKCAAATPDKKTLGLELHRPIHFGYSNTAQNHLCSTPTKPLNQSGENVNRLADTPAQVQWDKTDEDPKYRNLVRKSSYET